MSSMFDSLRSATIVIFAHLLQAASNVPTDASALESSISAKFVIEIASVLLITLGIVGELGVGIKITSINGVLRGKGAELGSKNAELQSESDELVALINRETGQLRKDAEGLKAENLRLEAIIAPRSLSLDQQKKIADVCRTFRGHAVLVNSYAIDGEAFALGGQIIAILHAANIAVADGRASFMVTGGFDVGVHIRGPGTESEFASTLKQSLSLIGKLEVSPFNDPAPNIGGGVGGGGQAFNPGVVFITVTVGVRPLPVLGKTEPKTRPDQETH